MGEGCDDRNNTPSGQVGSFWWERVHLLQAKLPQASPEASRECLAASPSVRTCEGGAQGSDTEPKTHFAGDPVQLSYAEDYSL